jgi:hypothetical protein
MLGMAGLPGPSPKGIRAFHGSPHSFDKFSMDKIGTGEGAQAYGHGLYFADSEGVAKSYRDALAKKDGSHVSIAPEILERDGPQWDAIVQQKRALQSERDQLYYSGDHGGRFQELDKTVGELDAQLDALHDAGIKETIAKYPHLTRGSMYEVNINADPESFLDWDAPLSAQPKNVQDALAKIDPDMWHPSGGDYDPMELGQTAYMRAQTKRFSVMGPDGKFGPGGSTFDESLAMAGGDPKKVRTITDGAPANRSEALKQAGIPGLKYLDAGSRAKGDGSRNYVVFDDKLISIVRKYGIAGASAMLGYNILDGMDEAQAAQLQQVEPK